MRLPFELLVGLRYVRAKRRNHFISFISVASVLGVAIGVMVLITVLSVMNGFERELRTRILGMASHATVSSFGGGLSDWPRVVASIDAHPEVLASAPYVEGVGMVRVGSQLSGVQLRGVMPALEPKVSDVGLHMVTGRLDSLEAGGYGVLLGSELARSLGVTPGDRLDLMVPQAAVTPAGILPRFRRFTVEGVFEVGMYEVDSHLVVLHVNDAQSLLRMGDEVSGVRMKLSDLFLAPQVSREVARALPGVYHVSDWTRHHANFFRAVRTEKMVMFIILSLIVAVAAFNIVSTLVMVVQDKQADIAILRTLGATPGSVMAIFLIQGMLIGLLGTLLGVAGGLALAANLESLVPVIERLLGQPVLPPDVYYISDLPSQIIAGDVLRIASMAFVLALISGIYPAWRASRVMPAEALRYE